MTVLTYPSAGGAKSDKVPLVDDVDPQQPAQASDPQLLESGEQGNFDVNVRRDRLIKHNQQLLIKMIRMIMALVVVLTVLWLSVYYYKRYECGDCSLDYDDGTFKLNTAVVPLANSQDQQPDVDDRSNNDDDDDDEEDDNDHAPCKTYRFKVATRGGLWKSLTSLTTLSPPAETVTITVSVTTDDMENVYKKLEKFAVNKALNRKDAMTTLTDDDLLSVFKDGLEFDPKLVQPIFITKSARFIHDFSVNITGIVDVEGQRCFVMPLMSNSMSPPASLYDLLFKMSSGYYSMDIKKVIGNMHVVEPAIKNLSDYGVYISKDCADYSTFKLE